MTRTLIGFNNFHFDGPVLVRRSQYLGVPYPDLSFDKYRSRDVDLQQRLTFNGAIDAHKLAFYGKRFKVEGAGVDTTSGGQIAALVAAGDWTAVAEHCRSDVALTAGLARRCGWMPENALVFDLETVAVDGAGELLEDVSAPSNYKDPAKIAAYIADARARQAADCALDPDLCRIVAIGYQVGDAPIQVLTVMNEAMEEFALGEFWRIHGGLTSFASVAYAAVAR